MNDTFTVTPGPDDTHAVLVNDRALWLTHEGETTLHAAYMSAHQAGLAIQQYCRRVVRNEREA